MPIYKQTTEITNIDDIWTGVNKDIVEIYFGNKNVFTVWGEYEGTLPATINANGSDLRQYQVYGNVGGVGDKTENLTLVAQENSIYYNNYNNYTVANNVVTMSGDSLFGFKTKVEPTTQYTVQSNSSDAGTIMRIREYSSEPTIWGSIGSGNYITQSVNQALSEGKSATFTTTENTQYVLVSFYAKTNQTIYDIMLTEGSTAPASFVPFGYEVDMSVKSENLFDSRNMNVFFGFYDSSTNTIKGTERNAFIYVPIVDGKKYVVNNFKRYNPSTAVRWCTVSQVRQNQQCIRSDTFSQNTGFEFIAESTEKFLMIFMCGDADFSQYGSVQSALNANCENGEIYIDCMATPIYIGDEPLEKVGNYSDYADYRLQKVVRAIKKYVLTGNENWEEVTGSYATRKYFRWIFESINYCVRHVCTCSHFTQTNITTATTTVGFDVFDSTSVNGEVLAIRPSGVQSTTLEDFKAWLAEQYAAGTPVTVWCALTVAEEADPPVPLPALPTVDGTTIVDYAGSGTATEKAILKYRKKNF